MSGIPNAVTVRPPDRRASRRAASTAEIVAAAWELARRDGLAGITMRALGDRTGMRAQSVYSYFGSKDEIYDAMFRQGYEENLDWMAPRGEPEGDQLVELTRMAHRFFAFCTSDPVRYQLLFQRTIPGFEPSPAAYAVAVESLAQMQRSLTSIGITDPEAADLATAVLTGLTSQQIVNDPAGDRWERLIDRAVRMVVREVAPHLIPQADTPIHRGGPDDLD